eukprot:Trichotokara_eunicae@DN355_c0_g1_i1.p1
MSSNKDPSRTAGENSLLVPRTISQRLLGSSPSKREIQVEESYHGGAALGVSDFANNETYEILERLSRSQFDMKELVETAREHAPALFLKAVEATTEEAKGGNRWATTPAEELGEEFDCHDLENGLTNEQVLANREMFGSNVLEKEEREPTWKLFLATFKSFVVILLLVAAIVALVFQEFAEGKKGITNDLKKNNTIFVSNNKRYY